MPFSSTTFWENCQLATAKIATYRARERFLITYWRTGIEKRCPFSARTGASPSDGDFLILLSPSFWNSQIWDEIVCNAIPQLDVIVGKMRCLHCRGHSHHLFDHLSERSNSMDGGKDGMSLVRGRSHRLFDRLPEWSNSRDEPTTDRVSVLNGVSWRLDWEPSWWRIRGSVGVARASY